MEINQNIFKAYDIRGIYGQDFDQEFAYELGMGYVTFLIKETKKINPLIVVGQDMRLSSPEISSKLISGLLEAGTNVINIGLVSTPAFYFAVSHLKADGGIMISASHNPKEWNGFKLTRKKAIPISGKTGIMEIKEIINNKAFTQPNKNGTIKECDILSEYKKYCFSYFNKNIKPIKIAADAANSMGAQYLNILKEAMPEGFVGINFNLDGSFPAHEADPLKEENLEQIKKCVIENGCDLGISTDGDGDRIFFIDNKGQTMNPALIRGLLAQEFLKDKPGSKIGYDIRPGRITEDLIKEAGGIPIKTRVGHSLIKDQMIKEKIYFAGESSGHFYLNSEIGCFEIPLAIIFRLISKLSEERVSSSELAKKYDKYFHSGEINSDVYDKDLTIKKIAKVFSGGKIDYLDGISVEFPDFWFNVRGSNTENKVRLNLEAVDKKTMERERDKLLAIINQP